MIAAQRSTHLSYSTDAISASLRPLLAAPTIRIESHRAETSRASAALDLTALYPHLFAPVKQSSFVIRTARAVAFRLSVFGTAAALLVLFHQR